MRAIARSFRGSRVDNEDNERYPNLPHGLRRELEVAFHQHPPGAREILRPERILEAWNNGDTFDWESLAELPRQLIADLVNMEGRLTDNRYALDTRGASTSFLRLN